MYLIEICHNVVYVGLCNVILFPCHPILSGRGCRVRVYSLSCEEVSGFVRVLSLDGLKIDSFQRFGQTSCYFNFPECKKINCDY